MTRENILITGATGFIGHHVVNKLLSEGTYHIIALVRYRNNRTDTKELEKKGVTVVWGNFFDKNLLEEVFNKWQISQVIHMAALRGGGLACKKDYVKVNVCGTETMLNVALNNNIYRFIFMSSVGVLGTIPSELPGTVATMLKGDSLYHKSKVLAEKKVEDFIRKGLNAYIVRPTITYGQRDNGFPKTLVELVRKKMLLLPHEDIKIHLLDVESLADLLWQVLKSHDIKGRCFIVADKDPISLRELVNLVYQRYQGRDYPKCLKIPKAVSTLLLLVFRVSRREKWITRILLISRSWYYDISHSIKELSFVPSDTREAFARTMLN